MLFFYRWEDHISKKYWSGILQEKCVCTLWLSLLVIRLSHFRWQFSKIFNILPLNVMHVLKYFVGLSPWGRIFYSLLSQGPKTYYCGGDYRYWTHCGFPASNRNEIGRYKPLCKTACWVPFYVLPQALHQMPETLNLGTSRIFKIRTRNRTEMSLCHCMHEIVPVRWVRRGHGPDPPGSSKNAVHPEKCEKGDEGDQRSGQLPNKWGSSQSRTPAVFQGNLHIFSSPSPGSHLQVLKV